MGWVPFMPIELDSTLLDAIVLMGTFKLKRLPVISAADGDLCNMVTQSSVVSMLNDNLDKLAPIASMTLEELGMAEPKKVLSIRFNQPVKEAFRIIRDHVRFFFFAENKRKEKTKGGKKSGREEWLSYVATAATHLITPMIFFFLFLASCPLLSPHFSPFPLP